MSGQRKKGVQFPLSVYYSSHMTPSGGKCSINTNLFLENCGYVYY